MKKITWRQLYAVIRRNIQIKMFGRKKLLLAFEFGLIMSDMAHELHVTLTPEIVKRAEEILLHSSSHNTAERVALDMVPNILATFETDMVK